MSRLKVQKRLDVNKLKQKDFCANLIERLDYLGFDGTLKNFTDQVYFIGVDVLEYGMRKHKDWFDDNKTSVSQLLERKSAIYLSIGVE